ncbi:hypothetical protein [Corynebacterium halotolerans]|uniref:Uncharacterized protein n=1 Tax=Corynebacterium halotolerans YIM 70093 = DSM 44683 TaxID=1121362 RepID=M1MUV7_9CORY|nr:hypothetical protein [Corynebacterium halotolerans]AGF71499.1 hypothetical protein A605_02425 [Corynebacterium halotolerans YIM 70093 = DSM 44683]
MMDPTRLPGVLDALRRTWEGQPDLPLATLFGMLNNRGIGWGSTDGELIAALAALARIHPGQLPRVDARVTARYLIVTEAPAHRVTVDPWRVVVRRITDAGHATQPGSWDYRTIRPASPGSPLVVADTGGIEHRLGVVTRITLLDESPAAEVTDLSGLRRRDVGDAVHLIRLADGETVLLDHGLERFIPGRRSLERRAGKWEELLTCRLGEELLVSRPGGGAPIRLAPVEDILVVEDAPAD